MTAHSRFGFVLVAGLLGVACGQGEDRGTSIDVEPEVTVGSQTLYQTRIRVMNASGAAHEGIAVSSRPFALGFDRYLENMQVMLASEGDGKRQTISFEARLDSARVAMSEALAAGDTNLKLAILFQDDDVIGWTGLAGSSDGPALADGSGRSAPQQSVTTGFYSDPNMTVVGPNFGYSPQHWCWAAYAMGYRATSSTGGDVFMRFWGPAWDFATWFVDFAPSPITINASSPWYNWGNWQGFRWGFYQVSMQNVSGVTTVVPALGCMFP